MPPGIALIYRPRRDPTTDTDSLGIYACPPQPCTVSAMSQAPTGMKIDDATMDASHDAPRGTVKLSKVMVVEIKVG